MQALLNTFPLIDIIAFAFFLICWKGYALFAEWGANKEGNLLYVTNLYRLEWMKEMLKRDMRTIDAIMIGNLLRSISFFANTTIFILLGLVTMLGYGEKAQSIIEHIPFVESSHGSLWEIKILLLILIFIYSFFKYTWSLRQYNYASIFVAAAPAHNDRVEEHDTIALRGAALVSNAARHFNHGLRAYYFGLAVLAWFLHPALFIATTAWVVYVTWRREYRSKTLDSFRIEG